MFEKYSRLPSEIQAVQFTDENKDMIFNSLVGRYTYDFEEDKPILKITTIHGDVAIVRLGDWIIKENKEGFYYPIKNEVFISVYLKVI